MDPLEERTPFTIREVLEVILKYVDTESRREAASVSRKFYSVICYLESNKSLKLDKKIMDDGVYESMLNSSRRFKEITVRAGPGEIMAHRFGIVLAKFKAHAKKLDVHPFPLCSLAISSPIMDAMSEVEELSLSWNYIIDGDNKIMIRGGFDLHKDFKNLKCLVLRGDFDASGIADRVPDNSLEALDNQSGLVEWPKRDRWEMPDDRATYAFNRKDRLQHFAYLDTNRERLQNFVNRQRKLKKLSIPTDIRLNLGHLALEELTLCIGDDEVLTAILQQQPNLRVFLGGCIGSGAFNELCRMRNLEVLRGVFEEGVAGALENLKELRIIGESCWHIIRDEVAVPELTTFKMYEGEIQHFWPSALGTAEVMVLSRIAPSLKNIALRTDRQHLPRSNYLSTIIDNFTELESLRLEPLLEDYQFPPPTRPNLSIKELVIQTDLFDENRVDVLDLTMKTIINVFRNSPNFISLRLYPIPDFATKLLEDALADDKERIRVTKFDAYKLRGFLFSKKVEDPFKGFDSSKISDDF